MPKLLVQQRSIVPLTFDLVVPLIAEGFRKTPASHPSWKSVFSTAQVFFRLPPLTAMVHVPLVARDRDFASHSRADVVSFADVADDAAIVKIAVILVKSLVTFLDLNHACTVLQ